MGLEREVSPLYVRARHRTPRAMDTNCNFGRDSESEAKGAGWRIGRRWTLHRWLERAFRVFNPNKSERNLAPALVAGIPHLRRTRGTRRPLTRRTTEFAKPRGRRRQRRVAEGWGAVASPGAKTRKISSFRPPGASPAAEGCLLQRLPGGSPQPGKPSLPSKTPATGPRVICLVSSLNSKKN